MKELVFSPSNVPNTCLDLASSLTFAKKRVDQLEAFRIKRLLHNNKQSFYYVFGLLPVLVHYNHPDLICYTENAPSGIYEFEPDELQQAYLNDLVPQPLPNSPFSQFCALYVMGSLGSVTQNSLSDIDLWLCRSLPLSPEEEQKLSEKLDKITIWAKQQGVDIHFYLMNPEEFRAKAYRYEISAENSGSAQHYFLLDEFYRSAIRLAGKRVLWLHILQADRPYDEIVREGVEQRIIRLDEWIDFGDFSDVPLGEYFGASLWQLYKGIRSPYKSAIKILLLESYAETYPEAEFISQKFKQLLLSDQAVCYHFDPYLEMLERVTHYLEKRKEFNRLECLRYCFYIKAMEGQFDEWRCRTLRELALSWGWKEQDIRLLDLKHNWKVKQAVRHHKMLVEQLLNSYRHLIHFARKFHIDPSIMPQDTDILMRKLYSVFEVFPGKVELINEKVAKDLSEAEVTFIEVSENSAAKAGWYLVNHAPLSAYDSNRRHVQYQQSLNKLVAWAYFNGVITVNTRLHIVSQSVSLNKLRQFIADLRLSFPAKAPKMRDVDLHHPNEIRNLIVAINLTQDPTKQWNAQRALPEIDLLNLSSATQGIIGSISIIYRNMWNEVVAQHFESEAAIIKVLKLISNKIYRSSAPPQSVSVFCYSAQFRDELQRFVRSLVNRCITVQTGVVLDNPSKVFNPMSQWQPIFNQEKGGANTVQGGRSGSDFAKVLPKAVQNFASEGFLQFFFEDNADKSFNVYVLDKKNKLEIYADCLGQKSDKIKQINRLYAQNEANSNDEAMESFNYPQFYQLLPDKNGAIIVPYQSKQHRDYLNAQLKYE